MTGNGDDLSRGMGHRQMEGLTGRIGIFIKLLVAEFQ